LRKARTKPQVLLKVTKGLLKFYNQSKHKTNVMLSQLSLVQGGAPIAERGRGSMRPRPLGFWGVQSR
jgi:hypothetical protein